MKHDHIKHDSVVFFDRASRVHHEAEWLQPVENETIEPWKARFAWAAIALFCLGTFLCIVTMIVVPLARFAWDWAA